MKEIRIGLGHNNIYIKYFNSDKSNNCVDIMLLSIFGASSKPVYQFMIGLYI